jgi:hypothetical protein
MSEIASRSLHLLVFRVISVAGNLVVLPFAVVGRRTHR